MPIFINEQKMVDENIFRFEDRIKSPSSRFIDTTPTFTTFYHIDVDESTTDEGFLDVATIVGNNSPIRYNKVENFPLYGIEQMVLQLQDTEEGLDSSYEGEAVILPGTIKPLQNDFFIIPVLKDDYMFRITDIQYDNIMNDNYYRISFRLEYIDQLKIDEIENQKLDDYVCILENIGTESKCIIEKSVFNRVSDINNMYHNMIEFYISMFYSEKHNVVMGDLEFGRFLYDPLQIEFINKHELFKEPKSLTSYIFTEQYSDKKRQYKYNKSIYKMLELRDTKLLDTFKYVLRPAVTIQDSSFHAWHDKYVDMLDIPPVLPLDAKQILSDEFVTTIRMNGETESEYATLIKKFVRRDELKIKDISLNLCDELLYLNNSLEVFFFTPIIMYIIREIIKENI